MLKILSFIIKLNLGAGFGESPAEPCVVDGCLQDVAIDSSGDFVGVVFSLRASRLEYLEDALDLLLLEEVLLLFAGDVGNADTRLN